MINIRNNFQIDTWSLSSVGLKTICTHTVYSSTKALSQSSYWKSPEREYPWRGKCWGWALKIHVPLSTLESQCYISCSLSLNHSRSSSVAVRILELPSGLDIEILSNSVSLSVTSLELLLEKKLGDSFMLRPASLNHQEITMTSTLNMSKSCMNWHMRVINHTPDTSHTSFSSS